MNFYFFLTLLVGLASMIIERVFPARPLPVVKGWWQRVIVVNFVQGLIIWVMGDYWQTVFASRSVFHFQTWGIWPSAFTAYFVTTFVYYWWHRWRHESNFLWVAFHQFHHSPQRIETITSFYKHPLEIFVNSILVSSIAYALLGLNREAAMLLNFLTAMAEYFYHMNLKTPVWVGYILQRPEAHRLHHQLNVHYGNFADLPLWDILFGTFKKPTQEVTCGFCPERELKFLDMMLFRNVNNPLKKPR